MRREHLLRVNAGRGGCGRSVLRAEGRWRPSFKGLLGRAACTGWGGAAGFPGLPLQGGRPDPLLSKWFPILSESPKVLVTPKNLSSYKTPSAPPPRSALKSVSPILPENCGFVLKKSVSHGLPQRKKLAGEGVLRGSRFTPSL